MPHQEAKLDEKQIALFIEKLRQRTAEDLTLGQAIVEIFVDATGDSVNESSDELAKTLCELVEPERLGGLVWMTCKVCRERLDAQEIENKVDTCFSCRVGPERGSCW